jgi:hypothetical protein
VLGMQDDWEFCSCDLVATRHFYFGLSAARMVR